MSLKAFALIAGVLGVAVSMHAQSTPPPTVTVLPGVVGPALDVARAESVTVRSEAPICTAPSPTNCPPPSALSGLADLTEAWSAERMHGRTVVVRNDGPGVLALHAEDIKALPEWRFAQARVVASGESALITYNGTKARWEIAGAVAAVLPPPGAVR